MISGLFELLRVEVLQGYMFGRFKARGLRFFGVSTAVYHHTLLIMIYSFDIVIVSSTTIISPITSMMMLNPKAG